MMAKNGVTLLKQCTNINLALTRITYSEAMWTHVVKMAIFGVLCIIAEQMKITL